MNNKDVKVFKKILDEIKHVEGFIKDIDFETFINNEMLKRSVTMTLINIGELTRILSEETKQAAKDIPFKAITATRNVAAHGYEELRFDYVWETVKTDIPDLKEKIEKLLS